MINHLIIFVFMLIGMGVAAYAEYLYLKWRAKNEKGIEDEGSTSDVYY